MQQTSAIATVLLATTGVVSATTTGNNNVVASPIPNILVDQASSPGALLTVTESWNLRKAFETCFTDLEIDGDTLMHSKRELLQEACPDVPLLQWDRLWRRVDEFRPTAAATDSDPASSPRRRLNADGAGTGIHMVDNSSAIIFGNGDEYALTRSDGALNVNAPTLNVRGDVHWQGASPLDVNISALVQRLNDLEAQLDETTDTAQECSLQFQARACMSSTSQLHDQSHFFSSYSGHIHGCMLVYHSGYVDCSTGTGNSNWGCHDDSSAIGTFILNADDTSVVFPSDGTFSWSGSSGAWYTIDDDLGWWPSAAYLYFPGEMDVAAGDDFHLQYGEAWQQYTTSDNDGTTCADIYWKVGDCDIQSYGRN